jgi:hypothetical protein
MSVSGGMMDGMTVDLGTLGGTNSFAYCLNNAGMGVGAAQLANGVCHAFLATNYMGGMFRMTDLNALIPTNCGWELMESRGINASGQIVGWGMHADRAFCGGFNGGVSGSAELWRGDGVAMQTSAGEPLTCQWMHDGVVIPGATRHSLFRYGHGNSGQSGHGAQCDGDGWNGFSAVGMFSMGFTNGTAHLAVAT